MGRRGKRSKANRAERRKGTCVYCEETGQVEDEDVIPTCLFLSPAHDRILIPSCRRCNVEKSKDDDYLRDMLVVDEDCSDNPIAQALLTFKVIRSHRRGSSLIGKATVTGAVYEPVLTKGGIYLNHAWAIPLDSERIRRTFAAIVRGLNFKVRGRRLPDECIFEVSRVRRIEAPMMLEFVQSSLGPCNYGTIGKDVFECFYWFTRADPTVTEWVFRFYWGVYLTVSTSSPESFAHLDEGHQGERML